MKHKGAVVAPQFSPDGQRVVTASEEYAARRWDVGDTDSCDAVPSLDSAVQGRTQSYLDSRYESGELMPERRHGPLEGVWQIYGS